jgi:hypothetical protein
MVTHNVQVKANWTKSSWTKDVEKLANIRDLFSFYRKDGSLYDFAKDSKYKYLPTHVQFTQASDGWENPPPEHTIISLHQGKIYVTSCPWSEAIESSGTGYLSCGDDDDPCPFLQGRIQYTNWYFWENGDLINFRTDEKFYPNHLHLPPPPRDVPSVDERNLKSSIGN